MSRHDMTDEEYARIEPFLRPQRSGKRGRPFACHRKMLNGIVWIQSTGCPWRDLAEEFGPWETVYARFRRWTREGLWERICEALRWEIDERGLLDRSLWFIDGSVARAHRCAAGAPAVEPRPSSAEEESAQVPEPQDHALGRSKGGFTTKIHIVTDRHGLPLAVLLTGGQRHDSTQFEGLMAEALGEDLVEGIHHEQPDAVGGDKAYSSGAIRACPDERGIEVVIATKENEERDEAFDKEKYRARSIVERVIGWLKERRRIATRYEKLAKHYLAMIRIEIMRRLMRI